MAGLTKDRRTGIYVVQFHDKDRSPKRKRVPTGVRESRAAERIRRAWEAAHVEGRYDPWHDAPPALGRHHEHERRQVSVARVTLAEARRDFLASRSHLAMNTRLNYERVTGWFVGSLDGDRPVASLTASDVQSWIDGLDVKPVTKANYVRHLRAWFRYCMTLNRIAIDPTEAVGLERVPKRFPKALRPEQVERVAVYAERHCRDGAERSSAWAAPFVRLGAETAMRRNELLHLRWDHVDMDGGHLTVACTDSFTSKSGAERRIPLSSRAASVLDGLRGGASPTGLVLVAGGGRPVHPGTCSKTVKRLAVAAGVPALTPHVLRHSCITWLVERGVPVPVVQRFAGHGSVEVTMRYAHVAPDVYADHVRQALG